MKLTAQRYEELLSRLLDGQLTDSETTELGQGIAEDETLLRDLREHLVLWDLWSQEQTAGRDPVAFLQSFQTRLAAEAETDSFADTTMQRLISETSSRRRPLWPQTLAASLLIGVLLLWWAVQPERQQRVVRNTESVAPTEAIKPPPQPTNEEPLHLINGELVCAKCALHQGDAHTAIIRRQDTEGEDIIFISSETIARDLHGETFCGRPTPVLAEGHIRQINDRPELVATRVEILQR